MFSPPHLDLKNKIPRCCILLHKLLLLLLFITIYSFYIFENNIIGVEATKVVP
jgi:hypothetical protein